MALETISSSDLFNFLIYETICVSTTPNLQDECSILNHSSMNGVIFPSQDTMSAPMLPPPFLPSSSSPSFNKEEAAGARKAPALGVQGRKKRRRRPKVCKNREEAETQRMTHIAVERNRRKQMNEHLAALRSLMPQSYTQRGDQASIVGGAIEYVKQLEHLLQSLEAQKLAVHQQNGQGKPTTTSTTTTTTTSGDGEEKLVSSNPFADFFSYPQYTWSHSPNKYNSKTRASLGDIEVTLIESHAHLRVLSKKRPRQLSKLVAGLQVLRLSILHLNVTCLDPLVLYSISAKVEEGCQLTCLDDIAEATHHMLRIIENEAGVIC